MYNCIYGPFLSRRLGLSLGIDLLVQNEYKICTFNCRYCELGITKPIGLASINKRMKLEDDFIENLKNQLSRILEIETSLDSITIGYFGEPTLISNLRKILIEIKKIRNQSKLKTPISIFTNSSTILDNKVREALVCADRVIAKLDAGEQDTFIKINRPHYTVPKISEIIYGLREFKIEHPNNELIIQTMLINGDSNNISTENINRLAEAYKIIIPDSVQLYSISRPPAETSVRRISIDNLIKIKIKMKKLLQNKKIPIINVY